MNEAKYSLDERRIQAALLSQGKSDERLYRFGLELLDSLKVGGSCLDYGAGTGKFTSLLATTEKFRQITAIDILDRPPRLAEDIHWISHDLNESTPLPSSAYDVLVALEIIEHLENPRAVIREWFRMLKPGGTVIASTPNNESWRALLSLLLRGYFVSFGPLDYPAHLTAQLRIDFERIFSEVGLELSAIRYSNYGAIPAITNLTWQALTLGFLEGKRFSDQIILVGMRPARRMRSPEHQS